MAMNPRPADDALTQERLLIPITVRIGITGQRTLKNEPLIRDSLRKVLERIDQILAATPHHFVAFSSLSEGSDRLLASEVTAWPGLGNALTARFELILPVPVEEYLEECASEESRDACVAFLNDASRISVVETTRRTRPEICEDIGQSIVQSCDVLVAIWDGRPAQTLGGTAEMMKYARMVGRTLFWIDKETGKITEERHGDGILESFEFLNGFNAEPIRPELVEKRRKEKFLQLTEKSMRYGLDPGFLKPLGSTLLPYFALANLLTKRYEWRYLWAGSAVYAFAAAAVATVTIQTLFLPDFPVFLWIEVVEMGIILSLIFASRVGDWHRKWIDYRFLSERLRTAMFLSIFCVRVEKSQTPGYLMLSHSHNDWIETAFEQILEQRPLEYCSIELPFEELKNFLLSAWIGDQISFYTRNSTWNSQRFALLSQMGDVVFTLTLLLAAVHAMGLAHEGPLFGIQSAGILSALTIILPAIAGAMGAIRIKREYLRNSERYAHMVRPLSIIGNQIRRAKDPATLVRLLQEANEITLREQQDWRVVFRFRELETP